MNESFDRWWKQFPISKGGREGGREGGKSGLYGPSYCFLSFVDLSIRFLTGMAWKSELVSNIGELIRSDLAAQCAFRFVNVVFTVPLADVSLFQLPFPTVNLDFVSISHCPTSIFWFLSFFFLFFSSGSCCCCQHPVCGCSSLSFPALPVAFYFSLNETEEQEKHSGAKTTDSGIPDNHDLIQSNLLQLLNRKNKPRRRKKRKKERKKERGDRFSQITTEINK